MPLELYENDEIAAETQADNKGDGYDDLEEADFLSNLDEENDSISDVEEDSRLPLQIDALAADTQADRKADGYDELEETDFLATLDKQNGRRRKGISDTILLDTARSKQVNNPEAIATKSRGEKIVFQDSQVSKLEHKWPQLDKLKRFAAQDQMITEKTVNTFPIDTIELIVAQSILRSNTVYKVKNMITAGLSVAFSKTKTPSVKFLRFDRLFVSHHSPQVVGFALLRRSNDNAMLRRSNDNAMQRWLRVNLMRMLPNVTVGVSGFSFTPGFNIRINSQLIRAELWVFTLSA